MRFYAWFHTLFLLCLVVVLSTSQIACGSSSSDDDDDTELPDDDGNGGNGDDDPDTDVSLSGQPQGPFAPVVSGDQFVFPEAGLHTVYERTRATGDGTAANTEEAVQTVEYDWSVVDDFPFAGEGISATRAVAEVTNIVGDVDQFGDQVGDSWEEGWTYAEGDEFAWNIFNIINEENDVETQNIIFFPRLPESFNKGDSYAFQGEFEQVVRNTETGDTSTMGTTSVDIQWEVENSDAAIPSQLPQSIQDDLDQDGVQVIHLSGHGTETFTFGAIETTETIEFDVYYGNGVGVLYAYEKSTHEPEEGTQRIDTETLILQSYTRDQQSSPARPAADF
ncbi:MAG: hypothetical protein EA401_02825 [Planctomycetota bacterium]|nr:MAG: hypothetical protein EA401_02825 [Planctomycetota bacterium]